MESPDTIQRLRDLGWLKSGERPLSSRLAFPPMQTNGRLNDRSIRVRDRIIADMLSGEARPISLPRWISDAPGDDVLVAEVDRYGLPLRTVLSRDTGLMRSDPYYDPAYIEKFYRDSYRDLYRSSQWTVGAFLGNQIKAGEEIWQEVRHELPQGAKVLDVGCGMGGVVATFQLHGCRAWGCDYGAELIDHGRKLGLSLLEGDGQSAREYAPFDLIVLSHVLEHQVAPDDFLKGLRAMLTENGLMYIRVPGIRTIRHHFNGDTLNYLQNAHVWHFTGSTMRALMAKSGFETLSCDEQVRCLGRRAEAPAPVSVGERAGDAVLRELRLLEEFVRLPKMMQRGVRALRRVQKAAF